MKKVLALILSLSLALGMLAGCGGGSASSGSGDAGSGSSAAQGGQLNLFTWQGMFPQEVLAGFTAETGIEVNYANFDTDENMLAKLETAQGGDYDVIIADDYIIQTVIAEGLAQKLDTSKLSGWGNINPVYQGQFYDPADEYTVPYGAGVQTIVYNPAAVNVEINGYADLWDSSLADNLGIIANYRVINGMALKVMGESYNTEDTALIEEAGQRLLELAPNIRLIKDDNLQDDIISGEVGAAVMYTSQVTMAMMANPELEVVFPEEGIGLGIMAMFIPSQAPNADTAYQFIDYILRPEISAQCFEYMGYYCTNLAAEEHISEEYRSFLTLPDHFGETEMIQPISAEAEEVHNRVWTEFRSACGQ